MRSFAVGLSVLFGAAGCAEPGARAPVNNEPCGRQCGGGLTPGPGSGGVPGEGGAGGAAPGTSVLSGQVFQAEDTSFAAGAAFRWPASVEASSAADRVIEIAVPAGQSFRARGVLAAESLWVKVTPDATAFLPTIQRVNTLDAAPEELVVVAQALMDSAFSGLASPVLMDPSAAQIIFTLVDNSGDPVPRLSLAVAGAEAIAYRAGGGFNDVARETDSSGLALAVNVPAGVWLTDVRGTVSGSTTSRSFTIRAARGAVTVARVTVAR